MSEGEDLERDFREASRLIGNGDGGDAFDVIGGPLGLGDVEFTKRFYGLACIGALVVGRALRESIAARPASEVKALAAKADLLDIDTETPAARTAIRLANYGSDQDMHAISDLAVAHLKANGVVGEGGLGDVIRCLATALAQSEAR